MERRSFLSLGFIAGVGSNSYVNDPGRAEKVDLERLKLISLFVQYKCPTYCRVNVRYFTVIK